MLSTVQLLSFSLCFFLEYYFIAGLPLYPSSLRSHSALHVLTDSVFVFAVIAYFASFTSLVLNIIRYSIHFPHSYKLYLAAI